VIAFLFFCLINIKDTDHIMFIATITLRHRIISNDICGSNCTDAHPIHSQLLHNLHEYCPKRTFRHNVVCICPFRHERELSSVLARCI